VLQDDGSDQSVDSDAEEDAQRLASAPAPNMLNAALTRRYAEAKSQAVWGGFAPTPPHVRVTRGAQHAAGMGHGCGLAGDGQTKRLVGAHTGGPGRCQGNGNAANGRDSRAANGGAGEGAGRRGGQ
jgi:hypothetical protein